MNAKEMIMKRSTIAKSLTLAAVTALALAVAPSAKAQNFGCSNASLQGTFAFKGAGFIISAPIASLIGPTADVNILAFDGNGNVTATSGTMSQNGNIVPVTETGTYKVNSDCTGTYQVLISPVNFTAHYSFVIDNSADEIQVICTDSGVVFSGVARRLFPGRDI